jgi:hypothetical protein
MPVEHADLFIAITNVATKAYDIFIIFYHGEYING